MGWSSTAMIFVRGCGLVRLSSTRCRIPYSIFLVGETPSPKARVVPPLRVRAQEDLPNGFRRTSAIKDVDAPADLVYEQIIDVASYPQKIDGVLATDLYSESRSLSGTCAAARLETQRPEARPPRLGSAERLSVAVSRNMLRARFRRTFCAQYRVRFATFVAQSYVRHECDPLKRCMTFHLDYDHKSDVSDQVGYW